jgi:predicted permease
VNWLMQDLRYAVRTLAKSPAFSLVAVATLALAIGATTAVFTVVNSILVKPLSYADPDSLVVAWERVPRMGPEPLGPNPRHFDRWREQAAAFADLTLVRHSTAGISLGGDHPQLVGTVTCLPNLFSLLNVTPAMGRTFVADDGVAGHDGRVILTFQIWQTLFNGNPNVVGRTVRIADVPREVIGVLPASFHFPNGNALRAFRSGQAASDVPEPMMFLPAVLDLSSFGWNGDYGNWVAIGRLKHNATITQVQAQLATIQAQLAREIGARGASVPALDATVERLQDAVVHDTHRGLWLLMAAVSGLMVIACVNLANAQLGRVLGRRRDSAVRIALGAPRSRVVTTLFVETALLTVGGAALGVVLAVSSVRLFRDSSPIEIPRLHEIHADWRVLLFAFAVAAATMIAAGLLPALIVLRVDPQADLQQNGSRASTGRSSGAIRSWLIGAQVAGCTVLLVVTGLFGESLRLLLRQDAGFDARNVAIAEVRLPAVTYSSDQSRVAFDRGVLENVRRIPGVAAAGLVSAMPLEGETWIESMRRADAPQQQEVPLINLRWVSPGYFDALRQPLAAGRTLDDRDERLHSAILSQAEARALFGQADPIGREVITEGRTFRVVGVIMDSHTTSLKAAPARFAYLHYTDRPPYSTFFAARSSKSADTLTAAMRDAIWQQASDVTIARVTTMERQVSHSLSSERFQTTVLVAFGGSALLLAMLGIYGVLSYAITMRRQEIGLRMALGATRRGIYALAFADAGRPVVFGVALGIVASLGAQRIVVNAIYGIAGIDALVMFVVVSTLVVAAGIAAFPPLRRAVSVDPIETLRRE